MPKYQVTLFFRKIRATGNFSMEASFERMMERFPRESEFALSKFSSSYLSNGVIPRIQALLEARRHVVAVNHVTGDVHFLVLGLPGPRTILTVHDCGFMRHHGPVARRVLKWLWLDWPVRHCRYVTAVSEATKKEIIQYTGCDPNKVIVIPTIIADTFDRVDKPFNVQYPRILHIGLAPNKNFERHVAALSGLQCEFHVVGQLGETHIRILEKHGIRYTSEYNISQDDMHRAFAESDMLLFASTLEGFGMPIIEAQSVGRAVVTSNLSSMPEVAGRGACLVDPFSVDSIRDGVKKVIADPVFRASLIEAGFDNVRRFDPDTVARQYESLYRKLVAE